MSTTTIFIVQAAGDANQRALLSTVTYSAFKGGVEGSMQVMRQWESVHLMAVVMLALMLILVSKVLMAAVHGLGHMLL